MSAIGLDYWFSWFPLRFRKKTLRLSLAADGAYRRLIDEYMIQRAPLLDDDVVLARVLGVSLDEWLAVAPTVRPYFHVHGDKLVHGTCEEQLRIAERRGNARSRLSSKAAKQRWKEHNRIKELEAKRIRDAYAPGMPDAMRGNATIVSKKITSSEYDAARASKPTSVSVGARPNGIRERKAVPTIDELRELYPPREAKC